MLVRYFLGVGLVYFRRLKVGPRPAKPTLPVLAINSSTSPPLALSSLYVSLFSLSSCPSDYYSPTATAWREQYLSPFLAPSPLSISHAFPRSPSLSPSHSVAPSISALLPCSPPLSLSLARSPPLPLSTPLSTPHSSLFPNPPLPDPRVRCRQSVELESENKNCLLILRNGRAL